LKVVVTSDQHLGYPESDKAAFIAFLDNLRQDTEVTHFVLLGDVVDMWRRDASGVFLESHDVIEKVLALQSKGVQVFYVAGNHDYHVLSLVHPGYPFKFIKDLTLTDGSVNYRLVHGYEFDPDQKTTLMALLCRVMSDSEGAVEDQLWTDLHSLNNIFSKIEPSFVRKDIDGLIDRVRRRPEERLQGSSLNQINAKACKTAQPGEILVFGHTHVPFVNKAENVVNTGSWVKDANPHNTYVELIGGRPHLYIFGDPRQEVTERVDY
jgi:UDP-2,3-diacylglucosamine pyrophosphatase LpxH